MMVFGMLVNEGFGVGSPKDLLSPHEGVYGLRFRV